MRCPLPLQAPIDPGLTLDRSTTSAGHRPSLPARTFAALFGANSMIRWRARRRANANANPSFAATVPGDVELRGITKRFSSGVVAVNDFSLRIAPGELVSLLGPSGCGKTTILRAVAGFVMPDAGSVLLGGVDVTDLPPNRRDVGMLFQSYALFPHMTVQANVGYGLRMRGVPRLERQRRVDRALEQVRLTGLGQRYPRQLSGGQQQRVALARAIVINPSVLLLDEPLSNLDAKLRQEMRTEIRQIQQSVGITTIFVTHDQEEALTLSDRVVVMNSGRAEQVGFPSDIYRAPKSLFVARFIGEANIFNGRILGRTTGGARLFELGKLSLQIEDPGLADGSSATILVRPESVRIFHATDTRSERYTNRFTGTVVALFYLGASIRMHVRVSDEVVLHVVQQIDQVDDEHAVHAPNQGESVTVAWHAVSSLVIPPA
jgi:spermidine/putrescine ABC transporter ATP-binding subunit